MGTRWRQHEERARKSSLYKGYLLKTQKKSRSTGKRPDFFGISKSDPKKRVVGDAKWRTKATKKDVNQVVEYKKHPFYAKKGVLHFPANAEIPKDVRDYAKSKNVKIVRTRVSKKKERQQGLLGRFKKKKYKK